MGLDTSRVLRIGVVYRGQVVAERVLDRRIDVSIGARPDCTIQIPPADYPDFPAQVPVAVLQGGQYFVVLPQDPSHGINLRGGPAGGMEAVKSQVTTIKGTKCVPIEAFTGGSLSMGDIILMFQFVRGDSVPTLTREETVLRVGLVHEDRLLSDQVFHAGSPIIISSNVKSTMVLPEGDYKGNPATFLGKKGATDFHVRLPKDCQLRLAIGDTPMDLAEATAKKVVAQSGDFIEFTLPLKARARASLGPYTLLLQVVKQSVTVPAMPRKSLVSQVFGPLVHDSTWTLSFAISAILLISLVVQSRLYYEHHERFVKNVQNEEQQDQQIYEVQIEEKEDKKEEEKKPVADVMSDKAKQEQEKEVKKEVEKKQAKQEAKVEKPQAAGKQVDPEELKRQARAQVEQKTVAGAFKPQGSKFYAAGDDASGGEVVAANFGKTGDGGNEEADGPGGMGGVKLGGSNAGGGTVRKVDAGSKGGFGDRKADAVKDEGKKKEEVKIDIKMGFGGTEGPAESKGEVSKVVARKNSAVQRCYEEALRDSPDEGGKVKVTFTVGTEGTVTDVSISGASGKFGDCIRNKFTAIRGLPMLASPQTFSQSYVFSKGG